MTPFLLSQILAAIAFACGVASFQGKNRRIILLWLSTFALFNASHFFVLEELVPGLLFVIMAVRCIAAAYTVNRSVMYFFLILVVVLFFFTYKDPLNYLALLGTLLATYGSFQQKDHTVRILFMLVAITWMIHNILVGSPVATLMEASFLISNIIGYRRYIAAAHKA